MLAFGTRSTSRKTENATAVLSSSSATPSQPIGILERYRQFQAGHPEHIVLMQVGDFFEIYGEAVDSAAKILDISTTRAPGKLVGNEEPVPMTGFPVRSFETYLGKLIKAGKSVVVAEQFAVPLSARFDRQITRIVTPGTVVEEHLLDRHLNNYILLASSAALTWMDVSTADFWAAKVNSEDEKLALLARIRPREILTDAKDSISNSLKQFASKNGIAFKTISGVSDSTDAKRVQIDAKNFSTDEISCAQRLAAHVQNQTLLSLNLKPLRQFTSQKANMMIDAASFRSLDIFVNSNDSSDSTGSSLLATMDECKTALGSRLLRRRLQAPMTSVADINRALDGVDAFFSSEEGLLTELRCKLDQIADMERILQRLLLFRPQGVVRDLRSLSKSLLLAEECFIICRDDKSGSQLTDLKPALLRVFSAIGDEKIPLRDSEGGFIKSGIDPELDELRRLRDDSSSIFSALEASYRQLCGVPNLRIVSFKGDQHVIEIPKSTISQMTDRAFKPLMQTESKARFVTDELVNKSFLLRSVNERVIERELVLLDGLRSPILEATELIRSVCEGIAELDLNSTLALMAQKYNYTRPRVLDSKQPVLKIIDGRHPILDRKFYDAQPAQHFTPNSLELNEQSRFVLLTGPNMGGKSTYLRQNALICLMAQCGSFVPARECELSPVDAVFTRIGASDDLCRDQSTFMLEMSETAFILRACTERSLLIIDEIGRGTSPQEGCSLASAIAQHLSSPLSPQPRTLFATHYHSIAEHLPPAPAVQRLCTAAEFDEEGGRIILIPSLRPGVQTHSFALPVAQLAGIPESIITQAKSLL